METVNILCPQCQQIIAVAREDIGHHVQCPLCHQIIQAQLDHTPAPPAPRLQETQSPASEDSSIFSTGSAGTSVFGDSAALESTRPAPKPEAPAYAAEPPEAFAGTAFPAEAAAARDTQPAETFPAAAAADADWHDSPVATEAMPAPAISNSPALQDARRASEPGMLVPILLIFLIPYALISTAFIIYLLFQQQVYNHDPLERMLEDNSGHRNGVPIKRIQHDLRVPDKLKVKLHESLQVGAVEITPLKVTLQDEDLVLHIKLKNVSSNLQFNPLPDTFTRYMRGTMNAAKPYIFLESGQARIYGGDVEWLRDGRRLRDPELAPRQEMTAHIITDMRDRQQVDKLVHARRPCLWRVQLRRGLEDIAGQERVITCVVGVAFSPGEIQKSTQPIRSSPFGGTE